jgi:hypothetical protein
MRKPKIKKGKKKKKKQTKTEGGQSSCPPSKLVHEKPK